MDSVPLVVVDRGRQQESVHRGAPMHLEVVRAILAKAGLNEGALQCGDHPPVDAKQAAALIRDGAL